MSDNLSYVSGRQGLENNLFSNLVEEAKADGTPSRERLAELAEEFLIGDAITYGTASFYDFLKPANQGKKVYLCSGSTCLLARSQGDLKDTVAKHCKDWR